MAETALIRLGVDISSVRQSIRQINGDMRSLQAESRTIGNTLSLEPNNKSARSRYIQNFEEQLDQAKQKAATLRSALDQALAAGGTRETPGIAKLEQDIRRADAEVDNLRAKLSNSMQGGISTGAGNGLSQISSKLNGWGIGMASSLSSMAFNGLINGARGLGSELEETSATWQTFTGNMKQLGTSEADIKRVKNELQDFATKSIYSASDMSSTYSQLSAVGIQGADKLVTAFGGLAAASDNPKQAMATLSQQATQMAAKPKIQWMDFKLMLEQSPAGMSAVAKAMGMSTKQLVKDVQDGKVNTQDFFNAMKQAGNGGQFAKMATQYKTVGQAMDGMRETLSQALLPAFQQLSNVLIPIISKFADWISKSGPTQTFVKWLIVGIGSLAAILTTLAIVEGIVTAASSALAIVWSPVTLIILAIVAAIGALVAVVHFWPQISAFFGRVFTAVGQFFINIWNAVAGWFGRIGSSVGSFFGGIWNRVAGWFSSIWSNVSGFFVGIWNRYWAWRAKMINNLKTFGSDVWNRLKSAFNISKFVKIGKNILEGIARGISNAWGTLKSKLSEVKKWTVNHLKGVFGIHSPSVVMRDEIGQYLGQGIGVGLSDSLDAVGDQASGKASGLVDTLRRGLGSGLSNMTLGGPAVSGGDLGEHLQVGGSVSISVEAGTLSQIKDAAHAETVKTLRAAGFPAV